MTSSLRSGTMSVARRLVHALIIVLTLIVGATAAAVIVSQTAWFKNWLRTYIVREANQYLNGELSIERVGGNLFFGIELEDIGVSMDGREVVAVKDLGLDYNVFEMVSKGLFVDEIRLNQPVLHVRREGDTWSIARLIKKQEQEADRRGPAYPMAIDAIGISDASIVVDDPVGTTGVDVPNRIDRVDAKMSFHYDPVHYTLDISHVSFRASEPEIGLNSLSGTLAVRDDNIYFERVAVRTEESSISLEGAIEQYLAEPVFKVQVSSDKLSIPEIAKVVPALAGVPLQPAFNVKLDGPLGALGVEMNVQSSAGHAAGAFVADLSAPGQAITGTMSVRHLNLAPILKDRSRQTDLTADAKVDLRAASFSDLDSLRGTAAVNAPRVVASGYEAQNVRGDARIDGRRIALQGHASAYGANATTRGRVTLAKGTEPLSYDLSGQVRHLDLTRAPRQLNVPRAETNVSASYRVRGSEPSSGVREPQSAARTVDAELQFDESTVAGARIASGSTAAVSMRGTDISYRTDADVAGLNLQRIGRQFNVPALAVDRYDTVINGHVEAHGRGTSVKDLEVTASGALTDTSIRGGRLPRLSFDVTTENDIASVKATGEFAGFDPAALSGKPAMKGSVSGNLDLDATVEGFSAGATLENVDATVRAALQPSTVGGLAIDAATIDADYRDRAGTIRQFDLKGRDLNAKASGTLALNEAGESNLTFVADSPRLEEIGKLVDVPLAGIAKVDGTVTGNASNLRATGTIAGSGLKYGENGALSLTSKYTASVRDLAFDGAAVTAETNATFVSVGGQNINELAATTKYADKQIDFDATARQPKRSMAAEGAMVLHPDHREVHLQRLGLDTEGFRWQLAPDSSAAVQFGADSVAVRELRLVSGDQQIAADGTFGRPGDALKITMTNVDLAGVDALLLRPPQLTGRLHAQAEVSGSRATPHVKGDFRVSNGGFRRFHYDTFGGTADYTGTGVTVDAKLQQNPTQWITAKGYLPIALFNRRAAALPGATEDRKEAWSGPGNEVDLTVDSSLIDLGVIQGFTQAVTDVKGTLEAHIRVTGSADDPQPSGGITVRDGAVKVAPAGVTYTNIAGQIDLQPDRVHIDQITVLDNHQNALSITGDLAVNQRRVGDVEIYLTSDDFKIVDNELGDLRIQSRMQVGGALQSPRVEGYLGVTTGEINLDKIIALAGPSPYPTEAAGAEAASEGRAAAAPSVFDALQMDVHVMVPNDLVVKARNLQAAQSPIGLGSLLVTLGGDLRATKKPGDRVRLVGSINTVRGTYNFQGRRFEILRDGSVRFEGLDELDPTLDIRTRRVIRAVEAFVNIRGTLKHPEIVLSSNPPQEQAEILSLIVFNQSINQLGEGEQISLAQRAQGLATGALAGQLAQSIGNALNLDTFEIDIAPERGGGPELTIGQQLGQNLYVKVQQGVGELNSTNFILEYELTDWLRLQANVLQGASTQQAIFRRVQGSGMDLIFFFSY